MRISNEARTIRVVLADDHDLVRTGIKALLSMVEGVDVIAEARNGKELVTLVASLNPDVVMTDISMPGMDGITAIAEIHSKQPEVRLLEGELLRHRFHGIISLHCDDTSAGLYGFLSGRNSSEVLSGNLLEPALRAAEEFLPRNVAAEIDGFHACGGVLKTCYDGVLRAPDHGGLPPFEITFETPQRAPADRQVEAFNSALITILAEYRQLLAHAPNL